MLNQRTFLDIFVDSMTEVPSENITSGWESLLEPAWLTQLMASVSPVKFKNPSIYSRYGRPARRAHVLNENQQQAYETLSAFQPVPLHPGFYPQELKSAYRAALLKTHPDQGGTAESFQLVRKSYEILFAFVTK